VCRFAGEVSLMPLPPDLRVDLHASQTTPPLMPGAASGG